MEEQKLLKRKSKAAEKAACNSSALVSACMDLASHYISVEQFSKAIREYEILCNIYKNEKKMILYAQANRGIGEAYMSLHEFDKSLKHFKVYYEVAIQEHNILEQQRALAQLGHLYLTWYFETGSENDTKLLREAYEYFIRSMRKCESLSDSVEKQDMLARLLSNLGLVKENLNEYETSWMLYERSIKICLKYDIYEQLYRGYLSMASLFEKQEMYQETIKNYNLAIETAKKLSSNRVELLCAALLAKSETLIKIAEFQAAKNVLRKAYKFKTPNKGERKIIERHLRVVAGMCKVEDEIITCNDQKQLKSLYEKMGDGACDLKNFTKAIEYYKKMLRVAEKTGVSDKDLGECYYSLGETYKDIGNFKEAEVYFEKEYALSKNNLKDSLNTICKLADVKEMANSSTEEIKVVYERGLANCRKKQNLKEEKRLLLRFMDFLRRHHRHRDAFKLEQRLNILANELEDDGGTSSSSDCESEDSAKAHIGDNIVLSDITDVSEASDDEVPEPNTVQQPSKRRKPNTIKFKKNLNGEWPLHVACIKGDQKRVQHLLDVDHPVNVRDNAGWLPIHEAAVHGHLEIVKFLLDHRASINDRGGSECNGITPLHDAASNGHLEVIELLLDRGASAVTKTDDGNTPLFELKRWYDRADAELTGQELDLYNKLVKRLEEALDKAGQKDVEKDSYTQYGCPGKENVSSSNSKVGMLRRKIYIEETLEDDYRSDASASPPHQFENRLPSEKGASSEYHTVMQTLRHKSYTPQKSQRQSPPLRSATSKRSALIDENDFVAGEDWLEDDIKATKSKKRKTGSGELLSGRSRSFGGGSNSSRSPTKSVSSVRIEDSPIRGGTPDFPQNVLVDEIEDTSLESTSNRRRGSIGSNDSDRSFSRRRAQTTLIDSGFSRERSNNATAKSKFVMKRNSSENTGTSQTKITNYGVQSYTVVEDDSTTLSRNLCTHREATQTVVDPTLFVDVEIGKRLFRVPILMSQIQTKTIKWLAEEAAHRYECKEYIKPVLELETVNGAILGDNDMLSLLFPMGSLQAEKVVGKVTEWSLPSVMERYRETCINMGVAIDDDLCDLIQTLSISLDISARGLLDNELTPLLKAINHQKSLTELNLSGNFFNAHLMSVLCSSIMTLSNLQTLNLSCTGLQKLHLSQLTSLVASSDALVSRLVNLDLSDNILLKNACLNDLSVISKTLNLRKLNLSNIGLGDLATFQDALCLKGLEYLDISYNELKDCDIRKIISWSDGTVLKCLNVSRNMGQRVLRQILNIFQSESAIALEKIQLERCGASDSDLFDLLRLAPNLTFVDLAYNPDLTSISLRRLLEHGNLHYVNLTFCDNIWNYFDPVESCWSVELKAKGTQATFKITGRCDTFLDCITKMFREKYEKCLEVERSHGYLAVVLNFTR